MKKLLLSACILCASFSFAQNNDAQIQEVFGEAYLTDIKTSNPGLYSYFSNFCENGIRIEETMHEKYADAPVLNQIPLRNSEKSFISIEEFIADYNSSEFNPLKYLFTPAFETQVFRLGSTSYVVFIDSQNLSK